jgi:SAM-dependent methyltransferase
MLTPLEFTGTCGRHEFDAAVDGVTYWYHSFYFANGYEVRGDYDIGLNIHEYGFPDDLAGKRVLDVGAASGWFSFYLEQRGAQVTSFDLSSETQIDCYGRYENGPVETKADWVHGRVYDLSPALFEGESFDLVFMGAILPHLRDPIGALAAARRVCRERLIATNWFIAEPDPLADETRPIVDLPALADTPAGHASWWRPNRSAVELWIKAAGFESVRTRPITLTADACDPEHLNGTQTLLLADASV